MRIDSEQAHREAIAEVHQLEQFSEAPTSTRRRAELLAAIHQYELQYVWPAHSPGQPFKGERDDA